LNSGKNLKKLMPKNSVYYSLADAKAALEAYSDKNMRIFRAESIKSYKKRFASQEEINLAVKSGKTVTKEGDDNIYRVDQISNCFKLFDSLEEFLEFTNENSHVCLHEMIDGRSAQHVYFDIDYPLGGPDATGAIGEFGEPGAAGEFDVYAPPPGLDLEENFSGNPNYLLEEQNYGYAVIKGFDTRLREIGINSLPLVYGSSSPFKISLHIIYPDIYVENNMLNKSICKHLGGSIPPALSRYFDYGVYSASHSLRSPGQTKPSQNRKKTLVQWFPACGRTEMDGFVVGWNPMGTNISSVALKYSPVFMSMNCTSQFAPILDLIYKMEERDSPNINFPEGRYDEGKYIKNADGTEIWNVMRKLPSYCVICKREHESDHMYVITFPSGLKRFKCRRAEQDGSKGYRKIEDPPSKQSSDNKFCGLLSLPGTSGIISIGPDGEETDPIFLSDPLENTIEGSNYFDFSADPYD
jgi:hypothetical protein